MTRKTGRMILIIIAILLGLFLIVGVFNANKSHAKSDKFSICYQRCLLGVPTLEECIESEDDFWEYGENKPKKIRRECTAIIRDEKFNCKLDCYSQSVKPQNVRQQRAIEFWDKSVRSFPETND